MTWGQLLRVALWAAEHIVGPWSGGAVTSLAHAYGLAGSRQPIAEAICRRFSADLEGAIDLDAQEHWNNDVYDPLQERLWPCFRDFTKVYGNGEFPWAGFRTTTSPPTDIHDSLVSSWEMHLSPITRWHLPIRSDVRVWSVDRPSDWVRLVEAYPKVASRDHGSWELPGVIQSLSDSGVLMAIKEQHAMRTVIEGHVLPDWSAVAQDFDGVHLSWAGFLTSEGYVADLPSGGVTTLRYWHSDRTFWFRDVFGQPEPLPAPDLSEASGEKGLPTTGDDPRTEEGRRQVLRMLGR